MELDLRQSLQPTITELKKASMLWERQAINDGIGPMDHVYYYFIYEVEKKIKDFIIKQEEYRK